MEQVLSFERLPEAVTMLTKEVSELRQLLIDKSEDKPTEQQEQLLTIQEAAEFLRLSVPTLYSKVSRQELPVMKRSKRLYFSRTELLDYLKAGRKRTTREIQAEAENYLIKKGGQNE